MKDKYDGMKSRHKSRRLGVFFLEENTKSDTLAGCASCQSELLVGATIV